MITMVDLTGFFGNLDDHYGSIWKVTMAILRITMVDLEGYCGNVDDYYN